MSDEDSCASFNFLKQQTNGNSPFYTDKNEFVLNEYSFMKEIIKNMFKNKAIILTDINEIALNKYTSMNDMQMDFFKNTATILNLEYNASWGDGPIKSSSKCIDNRYGINQAIDNCSAKVKCIKLGWNQLLSRKELRELITKIKTNVFELHLSGMSLFYNIKNDDISCIELFEAIPQSISHLNIEDNGLMLKKNELVELLSKLPKHIRHVKVGGLVDWGKSGVLNRDGTYKDITTVLDVLPEHFETITFKEKNQSRTIWLNQYRKNREQIKDHGIYAVLDKLANQKKELRYKLDFLNYIEKNLMIIKERYLFGEIKLDDINNNLKAYETVIDFDTQILFATETSRIVIEGRPEFVDIFHQIVNVSENLDFYKKIYPNIKNVSYKDEVKVDPIAVAKRNKLLKDCKFSFNYDMFSRYASGVFNPSQKEEYEAVQHLLMELFRAKTVWIYHGDASKFREDCKTIYKSTQTGPLANASIFKEALYFLLNLFIACVTIGQVPRVMGRFSIFRPSGQFAKEGIRNYLEEAPDYLDESINKSGFMKIP